MTTRRRTPPVEASRYRPVSLCRICLRPNRATPASFGRCRHCGGRTCACPGCLAALLELRQGRLDFVEVCDGLAVWPLVSWSEQDGAEYLV